MTTPERTTVRAYVNERGVSVPFGATAIDAVRAFDSSEADALALGTRRLTDSRGLPIAADSAVFGGAIFRLLTVRESVPVVADAEASAHSVSDPLTDAPSDAPSDAPADASSDEPG